MDAPLSELQSHLRFQLELLRLTGCVRAEGAGERPCCPKAKDLEDLAQAVAVRAAALELPN